MDMEANVVALVESNSTAALGPDPIEALVARLDEPQVELALQQILDHVDLLAILVVGLDGLIRRGDTIADALADGVNELKSATPPEGLPDLGGVLALARQATGLVGPLQAMMPNLEYLMRSNMLNPQVIDIASAATRAMAVGAADAQANRTSITGIRAMLKVLKDEDVGRALGFAVSIAKALGKELKLADAAPDPSLKS